ncbi:MAG: type ISP restriction/modification enzyme [Chloroflexota bacterium]
MPTPFETYLSKVESDLRGGKATEHTYRSSLELLMESFERGIEASNDPKHIECGAPDFIVEKRKVPLGYVETKDLGADLNKIEKSDQLKRYFKALHNIILTDYLEFRWYVNGEKKRVVRIASVGAGGRLNPEPNAEANLTQLFRDFYATETPTVRTAKELASRLAGVTHFIREQIVAVLKSEEPALQAAFQKRLTAFKDLLLPALREEEFADLYAQTMTYGLFAAKLSATSAPTAFGTSPKFDRTAVEFGGGREGAFTLASAYQYLFGNKFLRRLFSDVSEELDEIEIVRPYLQDIVSLLNRARFEEILADFGKRTRTEDPVVHFYETFLAAYDPKLRESRGVYYTPEPVVQFIVNSVDALLKSRFGRGWGLADPSVKVLDPATGTGTFLYYVIQKIYEEVQKRKQGGQWKEKSRELLKRIFGFELLIAPYVVSHLKLGLLLKTLDAPLEGRDERLQIYLTNTLEEGVTRAEQLKGLGSYIAEEASDAAHVKKMQDIMVVLGNPPYSGLSANASVDDKGNPNFIGKLLDEYYFVDGARLGERKVWLQDDYVKFIRFGEWRINQTGHGVLAFITNHGYLDNPTFRGMRQHLMNTFDEIYVLDLHGNSKKKEKTPEGGKDENVFDIQQGVAILLAVKNPSPSLPKSANKTSVAEKTSMADLGRVPARAGGVVRHASLWGLRAAKYAALHDSDLNDVDWKEIQPEKPLYLFKPSAKENLDEYNNGWLLTDIMPLNVTGIVTARDEFVIDFENAPLLERMRIFIDANLSDNDVQTRYELQENYAWRVSEARKQLKIDIGKVSANYIKEIVYRPFDVRRIFYHPAVVWRTRSNVMPHMFAGENLAFIATRQTRDNWEVLATEFMCGHKSCAAYDINSLFPLYLYDAPKDEKYAAEMFVSRRPNLAPAFIQALEEKLKLKFDPSPSLPKSANRTSVAENTSMADLGRVSEGRVGFFTPEDVFHYAYAVFHSPTYRSRYAEFLKIDFPRLPITSDKKLFRKLAEKGKELVELHLLKSAKVEEFVTSYSVAGNNAVEKVSFASGKVWINPSQYFGGVPESVWEFKVGGYQVCEKWLKDRKGRVLSREEIDHYQRVVVALKETMRLMKEIDKVIVKWPME